MPDDQNNESLEPTSNFEFNLSEVPIPICRNYSDIFIKEINVAISTGNNERAMVADLLFIICKFELDLNNNGFNLHTGDTDKYLEKIDDIRVKQLQQVLDLSDDPELNARIYDLLRYKGIDRFTMTNNAVSSYLESAQKLKNTYYTFPTDKKVIRETNESNKRIQRAIQIALPMGLKSEPFQNILDFIDTELNNFHLDIQSSLNLDIDLLNYHTFLIEQLIISKKDTSLKYLDLVIDLELKIKSILSSVNELEERVHLYINLSNLQEIKAAIESISGFSDHDVTQTFLSSIQTLLNCIEECENVNEFSYPYVYYTRIFSKLRDSSSRFKPLQSLGGFQEIFNDIQLKYENYQAISHQPVLMPTQSTLDNWDPMALINKQLAEQVEKTSIEKNNLIQNQDPEVSLRMLIDSDILLPKKGEELNRTISGLIARLPIFTTDVNNKVKGRGKGIGLGDPNSVVTPDQAAVFTHELQMRNSEILATDLQEFGPQINFEEFLNELLNSDFIPTGREEFFRSGLLHFVPGRTTIAAHILLPQIENSLREILIHSGSIPQGLTEEEIESNYLITHIFKDPNLVYELENIFGEDLIYNLQNLLVHRLGANIRNRYLHGQATGQELMSITPDAIYLSFLTMKMANKLKRPSVGTPSNNIINTNLLNIPTPGPSATQEALNLVAGKTFKDALDSITELTLSNSDLLESQARNNLGPNASDEEIRNEVYSLAQNKRNEIGNIFIECLKLLNSENLITFNDITQYIQNSSLISNTHTDALISFWTGSLFFGLQGKSIDAVHLLYPQIEALVRNLLDSQGKLTSKIDLETLVQDDMLLNKLFETYEEDLITILGKDLVIDMRGLLVEKKGSNLRNKLAHGFLEVEEFESSDAAYLIWLALKLSTY